MTHRFLKIGLVLVVVAWAVWLFSGWEVKPAPEDYVLAPGSQRLEIMTTGFSMRAVVPKGKEAAVYSAADAAARNVARAMNRYRPASTIGQLNAAALVPVPINPDTLIVLRESQRLHRQTDGAFDITLVPLLTLWKTSAAAGVVPSASQIAQARQASTWAVFTLADTTVSKSLATGQVDLGGIAKGYAIDCATAAMQQAGAVGGMVEIGGDVRVFGSKPDGSPWRVGVQNPFHPDEGPWLRRLELRDAAICTSGNYRRFSMVQGRRISHIIDPRTGQPVSATASVTVVAPTATLADAWVTALSVLGPDGLSLIPAGAKIQVLIVTGTEQDHTVHTTDGFNALVMTVNN
jgi:thiamine biosynthesis lipoprotein